MEYVFQHAFPDGLVEGRTATCECGELTVSCPEVSCGVEQRLVRPAHNREVMGSSPIPAIESEKEKV